MRMDANIGKKGGQGLVLYDGVCVLCSRWFRFVAERDTGRRFLFTAIQSEYGRALALKLGIDPDRPDTNAVLLDDEFIFAPILRLPCCLRCRIGDGPGFSVTCRRFCAIRSTG